MTFMGLLGAIASFICLIFAVLFVLAIAWWARYIIVGVFIVFVVLTAYHWVLIRREQHKRRMSQ